MLRSSLGGGVCLLALSGAALAQLDRGSITGTITDPAGAAIPAARIAILHAATGAKVETVANGLGQYSRPNLPVGGYRVTIEAEGFRRAVQTGIELGVSETIRLDVRLEVGSTAESIEVTAGLPRIQTESPQIGASLGAKSLTNLPLSFSGGRQAENFAFAIVPGVSGDTFRGNVNGSADFAYETLVDGASVTVNQGGNFSPMAVSVEALQEVRFQTGGMSTEFGRSQGGVFNYVMKSGGNQYHGSLYGGLRNEALNANTFANKARGAERPLDRKINYAGSFGGPVYLPKIHNGRNRTFFFFSHERYRERNYGFGAPNRTAPVAEFYQGDFSRLLGANTAFTDGLGRPVPRGAIYDPATFRQLATRSFKDFGPRFGFAWHPRDKWTVRGAYGIMYEGDPPNGYNAVPLGKPSSVAWGGTYQLAADPVQPWAGIFHWDNGFPNNRFQPAGFDRSWGNLSRPGMIDPDYGRTPYIQNVTFNIQRELPGKFVLDLGYVGNKATRLRIGELRRINQLPTSVLKEYGSRLGNQIRNERDAAANGIQYPYPGFVGTVASALRPYPQVQGTQTVQVYGSPLGFSSYHSMQIVVNREFSNGLTLYSNYVWSKTLSNIESSLVNDNDARPVDYYNLRLEKAVSQFDRPRMFKSYVSYDLPMGRGRSLASNAGRALDALIGGWNVAAIVNYYSGEPLEFTGTSPFAGVWNGAVNRQNIAAGPLRKDGFDKGAFQLSSALSPANTYLDKSRFSDPGPFNIGSGAYRYGSVRGFGTINENLTLTKARQLTETLRFQLRVEFFNLFNRHQLGGITTGINNANFGQVTSVSGSRQMQLSGRFDF